MCDCATELERKKREIENRSSLKSRSLSRVSSCCSIACSDDDDSPGLLRAFMRFLRGEISWSEVAQAAGFSGAFASNLGMIGAVVGGGILLAMLTVMSKFHGESRGWNFDWKWRKPPETNCIPKRVNEGPPKIDKARLRWPPEDDENQQNQD